MAAVSSARNAAFRILMALEQGKAHSDDLLRRKEIANLTPVDRNLTTTLVLGVLRWQIRLDHQIQSHLTRPNAKLDPEVRIALRLGAFQLRHLDRIPARAAIDESVELAKQAGHHFASRMVNALLRKIAADPALPLPEDMPTQLALAQAHPAWMVERWAEGYGVEEARAICSHGQKQPVTSIRVESAAAENELVESGISLSPGDVLTAARIVLSGDIASMRDGRVSFQDEGSQLVAEIAGCGKAILDCCAAPGGKTLILAHRNPEARIVACEASQQRLAQLHQRLAPYGERIECRLADSTALTDRDQYDLVLVDVPCSGTGTLGRNPEIRHRLRPEDLPRHAELQRAILRAALRAARPGARVVYSTCSLESEENEQVVASVLAETPRICRASIEQRIGGMQADGIITQAAGAHLRNCITSDGYLRLLPGKLRTDGFFIALLQKETR
jgi:16S rRNA (cytosine967-C5)-methyltransferase